MIAHKWNEWNAGDLFFGVFVPTVAAFFIIGAAMLLPADLIGIKYSLLEAIVIVGVPMLIGLIWNQWAGGASGFLLGSLYTLYYADQLYVAQGRGDISLLGNLVSAMLIGYVAGALNKRSDSYLRMLVAGVTAAIVGTLVVVVVSSFSPIIGAATLEGTTLVFLPRILAGVLVPLAGRAFLRHGSNGKEKK